MAGQMRALGVVAVLVASAVFLDAGASAAAPRRARKAPTRPQRAPSAAPAPAPPARQMLVLVEAVDKLAADYQAEVYSGVGLDDPYAKDRGLEKGLVLMVFEKQRRAAFRVPHEKIKRLVRLVAEDGAPVMLVKASASPARTKIDVLETDTGWIAVETATTNGGIFTTSAVYVFPKNASLGERLAALAAAPPASRDRLREALTRAQSASPSR